MMLIRERGSTRRETCPIATLFATNSKRTGLGPKSAVRLKPATLRVGHVMTQCTVKNYGRFRTGRVSVSLGMLTLKADSHIACRAHATPMPFHYHAMPLIHTCHAAPLSCSDSAVSFVKVRVVAGNIRTASPTV